MLSNDRDWDEILNMFPDEYNKANLLSKFLYSIAFIRSQDVFKVVDIQRYLKAGYGDTTRVIDALVLLGIIEKINGASTKYRVIPSSDFKNRGL